MKKLLLILGLSLSLFSYAQEDDYVIISDIDIIGNKVTKPSIVFRELTFSPGDTVSIATLNETLRYCRENILNTDLFNFVDFKLEDDTNCNNCKILIINVVERWYFWPIPYIAYADRNLNSWYETKNFARLSYGFDLVYYNMWGLMHELDFTLIGGYNQQFSITYDIPYITERQCFGLMMSGGFKRDKEVALKTEYDKVVYFKEENGFTRQSYYAYLQPYYRFGYRDRLFLKLQYNSDRFSDSIMSLNPDYSFEVSDIQYFSMSLVMKHDYRDDNNYPLDGHYLELDFTKFGPSFDNEELNIFYGKVTFDFYTKIYGRLYWASNVTTRIGNTNDVPYFLTDGLGYKNDFVRSYERYVVNAMNFALMKNNLKIAILNPTVAYLPLIKNEKFGKIHFALYFNVFFDMAYTWNMQNDPTSVLQNSLLFGTGVGIDFVTYYDKVLRVEYGINGLGESGLFLHLVAPI